LDQAPAADIESNCTGFLLTPTLLITNNHCISPPKQINFGAILRRAGNHSPLTSGIINLVYTNADLDFSLLRIDHAMDAIAHISLADVINGQLLIPI
jgi:hypothetical protein